MSSWEDMTTAPLDGTRVLLKSQVYHSVNYPEEGWQLGWKLVGEEIFDASFRATFTDEPRWHVWCCGDPKSWSTNRPKPIAWMHIPL